MSILETLKNLNPYPMSEDFLLSVLIVNGLEPGDDIQTINTEDVPYLKVLSQVYKYLSLVPNISQGGQNYSFTTEERKEFVKLSDQYLAKALQEDINRVQGKPIYGYKGSSL